MRKFTDFIVNKRNIILIFFVVFTIIAAILSSKVTVNHDMAEYLPSTSETRKGMDIMEDEFKEIKSSNLNLMFKDLEEGKKDEILDYLKNINGVSSVEYENTEEYNKDGYTLYLINVDDTDESELATNVYNDVNEHFKDYEIYTSGSISEKNVTVIPMWIMILAVACMFVILTIMSESYIEPVLFLTTILMAVMLNKGTNVIFSSVSNITDSISAILQMALSMDYSIMLMERYRQEKEKEPDKVKTMKKALYNAFTAISSSSITTIVGLLALVFMSFTIGRDMGFVLAKGVLLSLICIFFVLPSLILMCDKLITKTKKKKPNIKLNKLGKLSYKSRYVAIVIFAAVFIGSYFLKGNLDILYTASQQDKISEIFPENNQIAVIYENKDEEEISKYLNTIEDNENVDEVLGYSNTINKELKYSELTDKIKDLGEDVDLDIEDYLLKILYYKYYNPNENNTMSFNDFTTFIKNDVYSNDKISDQIDDSMKSEIDRLENFVKEDLMYKKRTSSEISEVLGIEKENIDDLLIYYNSKNNNVKISVKEFVDFMNKDVLTNEKYSSSIDEKSKSNINTLAKFTDKNAVTKKLSSSQMAKLFDMPENTMASIYTYYISVNEIDTKLSIFEFSDFVLKDVLNDKQYSSMFDDNTKNSIKMLSTFSNKSIITKNINYSELASLFGMDENTVKQLLLLKYSMTDSGNKLSIPDFVNGTISIKNNTSYLNDVDLSTLEKLSVFTKNENNINTTKMDKNTLAYVFNNVSPGLVDSVYAGAQLDDSVSMSPQEFVNMVLSSFSNMLDENAVNNLNLLKKVIDDSVSANPTKYTASQMSAILAVPSKQMFQLYALIDFTQNNIGNWKMTPNNFVSFILENINNDNKKNNIDSNTKNNLKLVSSIMSSTINNEKYSYKELSKMIGVEDNTTTKSIYTLYVSKNIGTKLSAQELVNFILNHKNDNLLSSNLNGETINSLSLLQKVINSTLSNKKYGCEELSNLLSMDKDDLSLLYGLYNVKYINQNPTISLKEFVLFILNDVIKNPDYSSNFDASTTLKLNTINGIMNSSLNNTKYTKDEVFLILGNLSDESLDKNTIDLLYLYYGSSKEYNEDWTLTIEKFVKFVDEEILNDSRFNDFIEDDMRNKVSDSKDMIKDAKELLIGNGYSRLVINTKFDLESEETFNFIQKIKDDLGDKVGKLYVIGDSPMAYEMSKSFPKELDFITVLTMVAIFVVVAVTFKSAIVPIILVLLIQCAVYATMGMLSFTGDGVYFIALLVVQSILMGATIDYAILYTTYYIEHRKTMDVKEAIISSYNKSISTILTSSSILILATLITSIFTTGIISQICKVLAEGTLCAVILILLLLPAIIAACDRLIIKKKNNN